MKKKVKKIYEQFDTQRKIDEAKKEDEVELKEIEKLLKENRK